MEISVLSDDVFTKMCEIFYSAFPLFCFRAPLTVALSLVSNQTNVCKLTRTQR